MARPRHVIAAMFAGFGLGVRPGTNSRRMHGTLPQLSLHFLADAVPCGTFLDGVDLTQKDSLAIRISAVYPVAGIAHASGS